MTQYSSLVLWWWYRAFAMSLCGSYKSSKCVNNTIGIVILYLTKTFGSFSFFFFFFSSSFHLYIRSLFRFIGEQGSHSSREFFLCFLSFPRFFRTADLIEDGIKFWIDTCTIIDMMDEEFEISTDVWIVSTHKKFNECWIHTYT